MKKSLLVFLMLSCLFATALVGQNLKKGNFYGMHVLSVELNPGVTMEQLIKFYQEKALPAHAKEYKGTSAYVVKGVRGDHANQIALMWIFPTEADRDKYFTPEGPPNELGKQAGEKLKWLEPELAKLATVKTVAFTDWLVE